MLLKKQAHSHSKQNSVIIKKKGISSLIYIDVHGQECLKSQFAHDKMNVTFRKMAGFLTKSPLMNSL